MDKVSAFYAYTARPQELARTISAAISRASTSGRGLYTGWEENDIGGRPLTAPIFQGLDESNLLLADITFVNFNVTFEIGYAIGLGRRVFLTKSREYKNDQELTDRIGIFDTLGYETYSGTEDLLTLITGIGDLHPIDTTFEKNTSTPVYILETPVRGDVMSHIISRVKKARLFYRSFVPSEESRMSAIDAIRHVGTSNGVVVPLLSSNQSGHEVHNIRAAFVSGLALGMDIPCLILQSQDGPLAPLDVRDFVKSHSRPEDINDHIHEFSLAVVEQIQEQRNFSLQVDSTLSRLSVGDPMAENEFQNLGQYYLKTDEFNRAARGEVNLVVGRKGTGKTALFSQVRDRKRAIKSNIVVDLKPEGYQLTKLKEEVLDHLSAGSKSHLVTAFWVYLLYSEITRKVLEKDEQRHLRDDRLYEPYRRLKKIFSGSPHTAEGDFSERLVALSGSISDQFNAGNNGSKGRLSSDEVTELLHTEHLSEMREALASYLKLKDEVWVLFDNLDKGWSSHGLGGGDIMILRSLIDATRKIQRDLSKAELEFFAIVFVRNDVYQLLMDESPDFGKESRASLDWSDPDLLRELMRRRLAHALDNEELGFEDLWLESCVSHIDGEETSQFMIDRALMRPRNLIKLFSACLGFAVNLQHEKIESDDIRKGVEVYSNDLLIDADQELTDIEPKAARLIYLFLGESAELSHEDLQILLEGKDLTEQQIDTVVDFLLYYGFLGIRYAAEDPQYIFSVNYNMEIFKTRIQKNRNAITYVINPALRPALSIQ